MIIQPMDAGRMQNVFLVALLFRPVLRRSYQMIRQNHERSTQHMEVQFSRARAVEFISQRYTVPPDTNLDYTYDMTFEELNGEYTQERMDSVAKALEEVLMSALPQGCITVGVYEAAKSLNVDPDNVVLCILATDDEDVKDVALQIHFTLIQAFCCENHINILRVNNTRRLAQILCGGAERGRSGGGEPMDLHCVLVTSPQSDTWKDPALSKVNRFCSESRCMDQWVPIINLPDR